MAAEIALINILKNDAMLAALIGTRVHLLELPQGATLPSILVRGQDIEPSDTKDGVSTLDTEFIQVLMYGQDLNQLIIVIEARVRTLLDRIIGGTYNGVVIQSSQFQDRDTFLEQIDNNSIYTVEHIYKVRVKR